ncbi:MAG: UDP-N-acetylmuramoyl-L-alanine--D-glutamate ligase [Symbiobacteriaceae bacterium]|nr:UDP-N-acetylmuramoyl-L-alanine--D-glutamate ligase [Symbiobacteriaceae bacterium]
MIFNGKKVLVLGAARSGVSAAKVLKEAGAQVTVNDTAEADRLTADIAELATEGISLISGSHPLSLLEDGYDLIVKNPGIPPSIPFLQEARNKGITILSEIELAYQVSRGRLIGITASNGKTTTTTWVTEMLKRDFPGVIMAGNIGIPLSWEAANCEQNTWLVVELSSFQLHDIDEFRCEIAAILNISPAHLDWHGSFESYMAAKENAIINQTHHDTAVLNADNEITREMAQRAKGRVLQFSRLDAVEKGAYIRNDEIWLRLENQETALLACDDLGVAYGHNIENAMAASLVAVAAGARLESIRDALRGFKGLAHRFQVVAELKGRTFINDSKATNPGASEIALILPGKPIVLIAGGLERGIDLAGFAKQIARYCRGVVLIGQTSQRLADDLRSIGFTNYHMAKDMAEAVPLSYSQSHEGDVILLSTGCASWDMYSNYDVRGDDFIAQVHKLSR